MSSNSIEDATLITDDSIISKFQAHKESYTVFTTQSSTNKSKYQSFIRFSKYKKILWNLYADNTTDAVINHIALIGMANQHSVLHWSAMFLEEGKSTQFVEALHQKRIFAKDNTFNSNFTHRLFKAAGISAINTDLKTDIKTIAAIISVFVLGFLGISWAVDL